MTYMTWDGMKLFQSVQTAATYALKHELNPYSVRVLNKGRLLVDLRVIDELWGEIHGRC